MLLQVLPIVVRVQRGVVGPRFDQHQHAAITLVG